MKITNQKQIKEIIHLYQNSHYGMLKIAQKFNTSRYFIKQLLIENNIKIKSPITPLKRGHFNDTIFDIIDTEEKAYWLGFIMGDGNVTKNRLNITLQKRDINHLYKFRKFLNCNNKISLKRKYAGEINISSIYLIKALNKHNILPNKTYLKTTLTPSTIPIFLLKHFYRGVIDADGSLVENKHKNKRNGHTLSITSHNLSFLKEIHKWFQLNLQVKKGNIIKDERDGYINYQYRLGGNNNYIKFHELIYQNSSIYLNRKYNLSNNFYKTIKYQKDNYIQYNAIKIKRNDGKIYSSLHEASIDLKLSHYSSISSHINHNFPKKVKGYTFNKIISS